MENTEYKQGYVFKDNEEYTKISDFCNKNSLFYIEELTGSLLLIYKQTHKIKDDDRYFVIKKHLEPTEEQKLESLKNDIINSFQGILDKKAQEKGYDNGVSLASYYNSTDETFRNEAVKFVEWRDKSWRYLYDLLDKYIEGKIEMKSKEEILSNMPILNW